MHYQGLYILDIGGKDEGLKEATDMIEKAITDLGGKVGNTQKMDKRRFERVAGKIDTGFYLNVEFELDSGKIKELEKQFQLDDVVYRQFYLRAQPKAAEAAA